MINLLPTPEQQQIIDSIAGYLGAQFPVERFRGQARSEGRDERNEWNKLAAQGWFGLAIPEDLGGAGYTVVEEMLANREFGRFLVSPRVLATTLTAHGAMARGEVNLVRSLVAGERIAAIASPIGPCSIGPTLSGDFHLVDSQPDDLLIAWNEDGVAIIERGCFTDVRPVIPLDGTVSFERARASEAITLAYIPSSITEIRLRANLLIATQLAGMAQATLDAAAAYAKVRMQFGKPIGSFQAVTHHCADMAMRARAALSQTAFASVALRDGRADAAFQIAAAAVGAADAALRNATIAIRVHGGMGFTAECHIHLYLKRAHLLGHINGGNRLHQKALLQEPTRGSEFWQAGVPQPTIHAD